MPAKTAAQQAAYDAARHRSSQVLLRLTPDDAQALKAGAAAVGLSVADYVVSLSAKRSAPAIDLAQVATLSGAVATLAQIPKAVRDLEADLGRFSGRLAHFFTLHPQLAREHEGELNATFDAVRKLMADVLPELRNVQAAVAEPRAQIAEVMKLLVHDLVRKKPRGTDE
jgi:uncharacterized protein (DUF1778 family)